jgi:acetate kinase
VRLLVVNAGSSSLKLSVLDDDDRLVDNLQIETGRSRIDEAQVGRELDAVGSIDAVGHRIVHGGSRFVAPVLVDDHVVAQLDELGDLAPLHQAKSIEALKLTHRVLPQAPAVACFDTAFHADLPAAAATYALPRAWRERFELRRYGFHGLSHGYASRRAAELLERTVSELRTVTCHLGAGASLAAVQAGRSVDTTMGFTPLEGLVMATRSGSVDPGLLLWLLEHSGISEREMAGALEHESGLAALAGTARMEEVLAAAEAGEHDARLALDVYLHRLASGIAAMAAGMRGLDALVFTGGVGEHAPAVRAGAAERLGFLGVEVDPRRNAGASEDAEITGSGAAVRTLVVRAREDLEIARQVRQLLEN